MDGKQMLLEAIGKPEGGLSNENNMYDWELYWSKNKKVVSSALESQLKRFHSGNDPIRVKELNFPDEADELWVAWSCYFRDALPGLPVYVSLSVAADWRDPEYPTREHGLGSITLIYTEPLTGHRVLRETKGIKDVGALVAYIKKVVPGLVDKTLEAFSAKEEASKR